MNPRDMTRSERSAYNDVDGAQVERVVAARFGETLDEWAKLQRAAEKALREIEPPRAALAASDKAREGFRSEIEHVKRILPATCAGVVLGHADERAETDLLERLARAERGLRRHELARPLLAESLVGGQKALAQISGQLAELDVVLERARKEIRLELAREYLARPL